MIPLFLLAKIAFYYLTQKISPFSKYADIPKFIATLPHSNQIIDRILENLRNRLHPKTIYGKRTFVNQHDCMICDKSYPNEDDLDHRVNLDATQPDYRLQLLFCKNPECQEIAQYSYLEYHFNRGILITDNTKYWNPFPEKSLLGTCNYYDQDHQEMITDIMLYLVPCYRDFIDAPDPKIYFFSGYRYQNQWVQRMIDLKKLLSDNPNFLEHLQKHPEDLDFTPHLLFPKEKNHSIQAYLQEIRNHFQLPQTPSSTSSIQIQPANPTTTTTS